MSEDIGVIIAKAEGVKTRQTEDSKNKGWYIQPPISFYALEKAYEDSFIIGGIFDKLATSANSGFKETKNAELNTILSKLDLKSVFENILVFGNVFIEKVYNGKGQVAELESFLTSTMNASLASGALSYIQQVNGIKVIFLPEEIIHSKTNSISTKYYGESKFSKTVDQIVLLAQIDQYYSALFEGGMMGASLLTDEGDVKLSKDNREILQAYLKDNFSGVQNAFKTAVVPTKMSSVRLDREVDTKAFLEYRDRLIESISIGLNIPIDLLISRGSNRSTSEVAFKVLNELIVKPMQDDFLKDLKNQLRVDFGPSVDELELYPIDSSDDKQEMEIWTGYKKAGIVTANEVREKLGLAKVDGGDALEVQKTPATDTAAVTKEIEDIKKSFEAMYDE